MLAKDHAITDFEVEHDFLDIGHRCMLLNASKIAREDGRDDLILLAIEDITRRRADESTIRQSEQRLKDLIEALPGAIYTTDAEGLITSYNLAAIELWGREPELGSDDWCGSWRMYRPDGTPLLHDECPMAVALKEGRQIKGVEAVAERPDGVRVPFLAYPTPLRDASGEVTGAVNMLVDITEGKRAEELAGLAAIVESSDDAIASKDLDGIIRTWNRGAEKLFGYAADEIIGKSIKAIIPPNQYPKQDDILVPDSSGRTYRNFGQKVNPKLPARQRPRVPETLSKEHATISWSGINGYQRGYCLGGYVAGIRLLSLLAPPCECEWRLAACHAARDGASATVVERAHAASGGGASHATNATSFLVPFFTL